MTGASTGALAARERDHDPDMMRAMLLGGMATIGEPIIEDREPAPVVILPLTPTVDDGEPS